MKPMNFAVIGCGMLARQMHLPNLGTLEEARAHTCCDVNDANLEACRVFLPEKITKDYRRAIEDPEVDAIIVATTETFRLPIIEAAVLARKPVYSEKPLADSLDNALKIQRIVEGSGIPFCVGHNRRASPAMTEARELFVSHMRDPKPCPWRFQRDGWEQMDVGKSPGAPVISIRINDDWKSWKGVHLQNDLNRQVGLVLSEGTHFVDLATWFLDARPLSVICVGQGVLNHSMIIKYDNGGMATLTMAGTGSFGYPKELLEAMGNGGMVSVDHMLEVRTAGITGAPSVKRYPMIGDRHVKVGMEGGLHGWLAKKEAACQEATTSGDPMKQFTAEPDKGHKRMLQEFIREIRGERSPVSPVSSAVTSTIVCLGAAKSLQENRQVELSELC